MPRFLLVCVLNSDPRLAGSIFNSGVINSVELLIVMFGIFAVNSYSVYMKKRIFGEMIADHSDVLSYHALKFTRDEQDAKDLLQNTFVKALDNYETYREGGNLGGWLYWIMRNTYINDFRKTSACKTSGTLLSDISSAELLQVASRNLSERTLVERDIQNAIDGINRIYAVPFVCHFEGYRYDEIADLLSVPVGTVKRRIHTARVQLQKALYPYCCYGH